MTDRGRGGIARSGSGWMAATRPEGLLVLASGRGRGLPFAAILPSVIESTIAASSAESRDDGLPVTAAAIVGLLEATHLDLRQDPERRGTEGLEALVAVIAEGRLFVIQAGGGSRCLRWRDHRWEVLSPLGERQRPALGAAPRVLIEVTSEPLREGDLVVGLAPASGEAPTPAAAAVRDSIAAWAERGGGELSEASGPEGPAFAAFVFGEIPPRAVVREETAHDRPMAASPPPEAKPLEAISLEAKPLEAIPLEAKPPEATPPKSAAPGPPPPEAAPPEIKIELPSAVGTAGAQEGPAAPDPEEDLVASVGLSETAEWDRQPRRSGGRSRQWVARGGVALTAAVLGAAVVILGGRLWDRGTAPNQSRRALPPAGSSLPPPITASAPVGTGQNLAALTTDSGPATGFGSLSARTEPVATEIDVYVDDRLVGRAPTTLDRMPVGQHRVRFAGPEHYRWEEEVMVRDGEVTQAVAPIDQGDERALVTVRTSSLSQDGLEEQEGDEILVDGERRGTAPLELRLDPGVHSITVRRSGAAPIIRVLELRRSDRLNLEVRIDETPRFAIEHAPPREIKAGETQLLTAVCRGIGLNSGQNLYLHHAKDEGWTKVPMAPVPGAPGTFVLGLPVGADRKAKRLRYYFSTPDQAGDHIFSPIYSIPLR